MGVYVKGEWLTPCLVMNRGSGLVGVLATNRLAELSMQTQARLPSRPCTFPCLHSDFVMTISGETPILCLLGKNKFEHFMMVDRTLSWDMLIQILKVFDVYTKGYALQGCGARRAGRPEPVVLCMLLRGHSAQWDNMGFSWKHVNHGSHYQCCQVFVLYC